MARMDMFHNEDFFSKEELYSEHFVNETFKYHIYGMASEKGLSLFHRYLKQQKASK